MAKVVKFPSITPEKFGLQRARRKKGDIQDKRGQLNLFSGGRVIRLNQLTSFEEALMLDDQGNLKDAKEKYKKAIEEQDSLADAYCNLGILESQEGNYAKAIDCFTLCLKHEARQYEAHYNLANLFAEVGNFSLAKIHYRVSIELEPSFPNNYFNLGLTLAMNKEFKEAVNVLQQYRALTPLEEHKQTDELIHQLVAACD
jgi:tetratricopeptide (TPR) repeat protein